MRHAKFISKKLIQVAIIGLIAQSSITLAEPQFTRLPLRQIQFSASPIMQIMHDDAFTGRASSQAALPEIQPHVSAAVQMHDNRAGGIEYSAPPQSMIRFRASAAGGARYLGDQVMDGNDWGSVLRLSFAAFGIHNGFIYGLDVGFNSGWSSRFNSVNDSTVTDFIPLSMHNNGSLDFLALLGYRGRHAGVEIEGGYEVSWIQWSTSVQQADSGVRGVPKIRGAVLIPVATNTEFFIAVSHTFNTYDKLENPARTINTFQDSGYVSVTDFTLGVSRYF